MRVSRSEPVPVSPEVSCTWGAISEGGAGPRCGARSFVSSKSKQESAEGYALVSYMPAPSGIRRTKEAAASNPSAVIGGGEVFRSKTRSSRYCLLERNKSETAAEYCFMSVMFCWTQ